MGLQSQMAPERAYIRVLCEQMETGRKKIKTSAFICQTTAGRGGGVCHLTQRVLVFPSVGWG